MSQSDQESNEADVLDQRRELRDEDEPDTPVTLDVEADPADVNEQSRPVPSAEEDWPDA